ncbi:hypothetical protein B9479_000067 [Cryptococcus floricola]|uniref:Uncharacterized protein n=1 Tax=Cryptococcus floricola TaxID=2591691 RepID=A0A5D3B7U6_9TREE|nr:hypothetical protein B9479_000067 [Cryptococcus floricola]
MRLRPSEQQWIFPKSALSHTPSHADGHSLESELRSRRECIRDIRSLLLRTIQETNGLNVDDSKRTHKLAQHFRGLLTVCATLVHRFYMRRSLKDFGIPVVAGTILWMASKIDESSLKLRYIVNNCLHKYHPFEEGYTPWIIKDAERAPAQSAGHSESENSIVNTEQIALEALCFDLDIEQPWVILWRSVKGLDELSGVEDRKSGEKANGHGSGVKVSEALVTALGWPILSEISLSPMPILYTASTIAFATFAIIISSIESVPLCQGLSAAAELGDKFHLDVRFSEEGPVGNDLEMISGCLKSFREYVKMELISFDYGRYILPDPEGGLSKPAKRRFGPNSTVEEASSDGATKKGKDEGKEQSGSSQEQAQRVERTKRDAEEGEMASRSQAVIGGAEHSAPTPQSRPATPAPPDSAV